MADVQPMLAGAVAGALTGALAGTLFGTMVAPTRAEREERGRRRVESRRDIGVAAKRLIYKVTESRTAKYRRVSVDQDGFEGAAVEFAAEVASSCSLLPWLERKRLQWRLKRSVGARVIRLAELRPVGSYDAGGDSARLLAIADTRIQPSILDLLDSDPLDSSWDKTIEYLNKIQSQYR